MQHAKRVEENINAIPVLPVEDLEEIIENKELTTETQDHEI
jgi:hypothetical protein